MTKFKNNKNNGFALLYAILLTGAILSVGVILMNIITKQIIFSSVMRNSENSYYYAANSGRECLKHYINKTDAFFDGEEYTPGIVNLKCSTGVIIPMRQISSIGSRQNRVVTYSSGDIPISFIEGTAIKLDITFDEKRQKESNYCPPGETAIEKAWAKAQAEGQSSVVVGSRTAKRTLVYIASYCVK